MSASRWQQVKELFYTALDRGTVERAGLLSRWRMSSPTVAREVESLLNQHETDETFLNGDALEDMGDTAPTLIRDPASSPLDDFVVEGRAVGPYRLSCEIGRGGMGAVYKAVRESDYEQQVAVKLVRPGLVHPSVMRRFLDERQILAQLNHPNIARLLDGGTTDDGDPYLVMEYIEGAPIDKYCKEHRLDVDARLSLLETVCHAVDYAHQSLVVHRDLKPSNILVDGNGVPKLLDFGIAKLLKADLTPATSLTRTHALGPMTPEYASPEQFYGEKISTASDVYSLGVIAYLLLSGHPPYRLAGRTPEQQRRMVCEIAPERPSAAVLQQPEMLQQPDTHYPEPPKRLRRTLLGDLDNIVLKSLRKDPRRRYRTARELADELQRYRSGQPVEARGESWLYVGRKWARRHRGWLVAGALMFLSLVSGLVATERQARMARQERQLAEERYADLGELTDALLRDFQAHLDRLDARRSEGQRSEIGGADAETLGLIAAGYARLADAYSQRGATEAAAAAYGRALALYRSPGAVSLEDRSVRMEEVVKRLDAIQAELGKIPP